MQRNLDLLRVHDAHARHRERCSLDRASHRQVRGVGRPDDSGLAVIVVDVHHLREQIVNVPLAPMNSSDGPAPKASRTA